MNIGIIVATHGKLAEELMNTSRMLLGGNELIPTICYLPQHSIETLLEMFSTAIASLESKSSIIIFCDMKGGSPCNMALRMAKTDQRILVISGVNIPLLLETLAMLGNEQEITLNEKSFQPANQKTDIIAALSDVLNHSVEILNKE